MRETRDIDIQNIMMDPTKITPGSFHFARHHRSMDNRKTSISTSRTYAQPRYILIDFGESRQFEAGCEPFRTHGVVGHNTTLPEYQENTYNLYDPFAADVYTWGAVVQKAFLQVSCVVYPLSCRLTRDVDRITITSRCLRLLSRR